MNSIESEPLTELAKESQLLELTIVPNRKISIGLRENISVLRTASALRIFEINFYRWRSVRILLSLISSDRTVKSISVNSATPNTDESSGNVELKFDEGVIKINAEETSWTVVERIPLVDLGK